MKVKWILWDDVIGESEIGMQVTHGTKHVPHSVVYVCFKCGEAWGKISVDDPISRHFALPRLCPNHGPGFLGHRKETLYKPPMEVMKRELDLMRLNPTVDYESHLGTGGM